MTKKLTRPSLWKVFAARLKGQDFIYENFFKGKQTLDVGCGEGEFTVRAPEFITGVDLNPDAVARLKEKGIRAFVGNATKLPFPDASFEGSHCRNILEHLVIDDALAMLREMERVVKPGGIVVVASEVVTSKFWHTFGHTKPYPPEAVMKVMRPVSRDRFQGVKHLEPQCVIYIGHYFRNKFLYALSVAIAYYLPILRREYFLVLRKPD